MKLKSAVVCIVVAVFAVITLLALHSGTVPYNKTINADALPLPATIKTETPQRRDFAEKCNWFGKVESREKTKIVALETGRVVSIAAVDGMPVRKGDLLFSIGGPLIDIRLDALHNQSATLQERMTLAQQTVNIKQDALSHQFAKRDELASAKDTLARLKTEMESVRQELQRLQESIHVRATLDGVFTNRRVSVGQEVQKGDELAELISQTHVYIEATLFPKDSEAELKKKRAVINLPGQNSVMGNITSVLPRKTAEGATVVWIEGPDLPLTLRPGQTVTGSVVFSVHKKMIAVPQDAIMRDDKERDYVFLEDSSGYRKKPVKTGIVSNGWVEILSGLTEKNEVVVRGAYELFYRDFNKIYKVAD